MLKEVLASNGAKLVAACVCPIAGATAIALKVPEVRAAVHKATAPKPERHARAKPRVRTPAKEEDKDREQRFESAAVCPPPAVLQNGSIEPRASAALDLQPVRIVESRVSDRVYVPAPCSAVSEIGGGVAGRIGAVPEPATWAQMIAGFALMGATLRAGRRRATRRPA